MAVKTVFTTGEAAKICKVSQQTIIRCFDSGQLKGFRVPGSRFRRIPRDQLFAFMKNNGIPTDALESGKRKILVVDDVVSTGESLRALEQLVEEAGGIICGRMAILAEGDAQDREDLIYLEKLPLFNAEGQPL